MLAFGAVGAVDAPRRALGRLSMGEWANVQIRENGSACGRPGRCPGPGEWFTQYWGVGIHAAYA